MLKVNDEDWENEFQFRLKFMQETSQADQDENDNLRFGLKSTLIDAVMVLLQ